MVKALPRHFSSDRYRIAKFVVTHYVICLDSADSSCGGNVTDSTLHFTSNKTNTTTGLNCKWNIERNYSFHFLVERFDNFGDSDFLCWSTNEPISGDEPKAGCWSLKRKPSTGYYIKGKMQLMFLSSGNKSAAMFDIVIRKTEGK